MSTLSAGGASEGHVAQAVRDALARGNAVDAVVTGVLVAAASSPGVFLGPVQMLFGGAGAGISALDGRLRQPGLGIPRPRGVLAGESVPLAARIGVPVMPSALAAVLAAAGTMTLTRAAAPAVEYARKASPERALLLRAFGRRGVGALTEDGTAGELIALAGRAAGGALTNEDLATVRPEIVACDPKRYANGVLRVPWEAPASATDGTQVVAAADRRGMLAIACYEVVPAGLPIPALGLVAPVAAAPVMRGEARTRPGAPLPVTAPIALRVRQGQPDATVGIGTVGSEEALNAILGALDDEALLRAAIEGAPGRPSVIIRTRYAARVVS